MTQAKPIEVRLARESDLPAVAAIAEAGWKHAYQGLISPQAIDEVLAQWYSAEALRRRLEWGGLEVATVDDEAAGFMQHARVGHDVHEVYAIYVRPDLIGAGAGWALWQRGLQVAAAGNASAIELWVLEGNTLGIGWYERQGGTEIGRRIVEMPDGEHTELRFRFTLT